jgi:hypothetical protein
VLSLYVVSRDRRHIATIGVMSDAKSLVVGCTVSSLSFLYIALSSRVVVVRCWKLSKKYPPHRHPKRCRRTFVVLRCRNAHVHDIVHVRDIQENRIHLRVLPLGRHFDRRSTVAGRRSSCVAFGTVRIRMKKGKNVLTGEGRSYRLRLAQLAQHFGARISCANSRCFHLFLS